jgi:hypothetical protein
VAGAHLLVLSSVRAGDVLARRCSVVNGEAPMVIIDGGVVLEHQRGKAGKEGLKKKGKKSRSMELTGRQERRRLRF